MALGDSVPDELHRAVPDTSFGCCRFTQPLLALIS